jgi:UDP-N-acetylmuramate--alanine ligase
MIADYGLDLTRSRRLHLVGAGGSGMAPFARLLAAEGHMLSGADRRANEAVAALRADGIPIVTDTEADVLPAGLDAVIHSAAVPADSTALVQARAAAIPVFKYARAVGLYSQGKRTLAVAGTHGKTTTTGLLAYVLRRAGADPTYLVGGNVPQLEGSALGSSDLLAVEACEYDRSFLHLTPEIAVVTNVEADHLDYFRDMVEICAAFRTFAAQVSNLLVLHENLRETIGRAGGVRARVRTFGTSPDADLRVYPDIRGKKRSRGFVVDGREYKLGLSGFHNVLNAAAVMCVTDELGCDRAAVARGLAEFRGVGRRLEIVGRPRGISVVDDYAHHPTEVACGIRTLRDEYAPRRLWVVFQPHQYSRLRRFLKEFAGALTDADCVVVPEIYAARDAEEDRRAVRPDDLVEEIRNRGGNAVHIPDFGAIVDFVRTQAKAGDVVVTMGAGDVGDVAGRLAATV